MLESEFQTHMQIATRMSRVNVFTAAYLLAGFVPPAEPAKDRMRPAVVTGMRHLVLFHPESEVELVDKQAVISQAWFTKLLKLTKDSTCVWRLFPHIMAIHAAYILATKSSPPDGCDYFDDVPVLVKEMSLLIAQEIDFEAVWVDKEFAIPLVCPAPIVGPLTQEQFQRLLIEFDVDLEKATNTGSTSAGPVLQPVHIAPAVSNLASSQADAPIDDLKRQLTACQPPDLVNQPACDTGDEPTGQEFPPLRLVTNPTVTTAAAAYYLNRKAQTLRSWATYENGAIRPIRVGGRLAWKTEDLRRVLQAGG